MQTQFTNAYVLNVLSDDHPGIIAAVSGAIVLLRGNIDACSQTVLGGFFTQILVVSLPEPIECAALAQKIRAVRAGAPLGVEARPYVPAAGPAGKPPVDRFVITAFGKDKPGIIYRFSQYLAGRDINITDLFWDRTNDDFVLVTQVEIPTHCEISMLQADLEDIGKEQGFAVRLQHENIFVATNQLRLPRS